MSLVIDLGPVMPVPKGDWDATTTYERNNIVRHNSAAWICNTNSSVGIEPNDNSGTWYRLVADTSSVSSIIMDGVSHTGDVTIDVTPKSHASATDEFGKGSDTLYGHVRLTDNSDSSYGVNDGYAATPSAVKYVHDMVTEAIPTINATEATANSAYDTASQTAATVEQLQESVEENTVQANRAISGMTVSGKIITFTRNDGSTGTITTQDTNTDTKVTNTLNTTAKAYITGTTNAKTNTGTQVFDTGVYLTTTAGVLHCTKLEAGNGTIWVA